MVRFSPFLQRLVIGDGGAIGSASLRNGVFLRIDLFDESKPRGSVYRILLLRCSLERVALALG